MDGTTISDIIINIAITATFMVFELFIIAKWIERSRQKSNSEAWAPFRKMMLDAIVRFADEMLAISYKVDSELTTFFAGKEQDYETLHNILTKAYNDLGESRRNFYYILQTVAPSLQPYAAQYCSEVMWFHDAYKGDLKKALRSLDTSYKGHYNEIKNIFDCVPIYRDTRFTHFKKDFTQSVWKKENLHYHEKYGDGRFLTPHDYEIALNTDRLKREQRSKQDK